MEVIGKHFVLVKKLHKNENTQIQCKQNRSPATILSGLHDYCKIQKDGKWVS